MVAELRSELRTFEPVSAMSAASAASAAAAAATQPVDPIALQAWCGAVEGRLDEHTTRITGVGLNLEQLIGHAKDAMKLVVDGVGAELTGFKRQVHHDHGKLDAVVAQIRSSTSSLRSRAWCKGSPWKRRRGRRRWTFAPAAPSSALAWRSSALPSSLRCRRPGR